MAKGGTRQMIIRRIQQWYRKGEQVILGLVGLLLIAVVWQIVSSMGWVNPLLMSSPSQIAKATVLQSAQGDIWSSFFDTMTEFVLAFAMSIVFGVFIGLIMGWFRKVEYIADPFVWLFYSTPLIAFYPLFVIWFGLGFKTAVMMGFLMSIIPIIVNTYEGVKGTNPILIRAARSFGGNSRQILLKIVIPGALPMIVTGWRIGVERALIGVIVGEMFSSNQGLGFRISYFGARLQTADLFVAIILVVLTGLLLTQLLRILENRLMNWQR
jgi:ABC-type nitrate/sulfonate/bicarbonate transport system permease component